MKASGTLCGACALLLLATTAIHFTPLEKVVELPRIIQFETNLIPIISEHRGLIRKSYVGEGSTVHVGDPLIQLDAEELLRKQRAIESRIHFDELRQASAHHDLTKLYSELQEAQLNLNSLTITSDTDGEIVFLLAIYPGKELAAGCAVAVIRKLKRR